MGNVLRIEQPAGHRHVELWTLDLPEQRNPISGEEMAAEFQVHTRRVDRDPEVRSVVLTGAGSAFSSGGNLRDMREKAGMFSGGVWAQRTGYRHGIQQIPLSMYACETPFVAAVNGPAVGAGCDLALMCDVRLASTTAWFAESFVRLGLVPGDGGAWLLSHAVGPARAAEMALTGDRIDAQTALDWGLVSRVCGAEDLVESALDLAGRIAVHPPHATRMTKKLLREARRRDLVDNLELAASMQVVAQQTDDHAEALTAMIEGRDARFTGS
jgi:enoyl-CoA hydratase/carnithine racemase